jgi:hypothetical protein
MRRGEPPEEKILDKGGSVAGAGQQQAFGRSNGAMRHASPEIE